MNLLFAQTDAAAQSSTVIVQSIWDFLVKGGPMMVPIALCSLVALAVIIERSISLRSNTVIPPGFLEGLRNAYRSDTNGRWQAAEYCEQNPSPISRVFRAGLRHIDGAEALREKRIEEAGAREVFHLKKNLRVLSVIATIAPVMGLLGTVFGMIKAFQTVSVSGEALGKTELLAKGIYEALITTAAGLVLAIPVLIAYHWLSARIGRLVYDMDRVTIDFFEERTESVRTMGRVDGETDRIGDGAGEFAPATV